MNIDSIITWIKDTLANLDHGNIMVSINVSDGKIVFIRKRKEETEKSVDFFDEDIHNIDN